jgi:hypothetical protein
MEKYSRNSLITSCPESSLYHVFSVCHIPYRVLPSCFISVHVMSVDQSTVLSCFILSWCLVLPCLVLAWLGFICLSLHVCLPPSIPPSVTRCLCLTPSALTLSLCMVRSMMQTMHALQRLLWATRSIEAGSKVCLVY